MSDMTGAVAMVSGASRGIVALASDPDVLRWTGRALTSHALALAYGFTDVDGRMPVEPPWQPSV